jgi:hypothetical protein
MSEKPGLANSEFSQTETLANGAAIDTGFIDMATADKYQVSFISSATGLTLETQSKAINEDSALSNSFTYDGMFFNGSFPVRQRFMRFILTNNTGSELSGVNLEIKTTYGSSDKLTVAPINTGVSDSTPAAVNRSLAVCQVSTVNSSTINLSTGNSYTFTGAWEQNFQPDVMINLYADQICELKLQFSNDGSTIHSTLTKLTTASINEFTTSVKGARYFRVVVTTDSLTTTTFSLQTQYGIFRAGNAPQNLNLSLDADALTVRPSNFQDEVTIGRRVGVTPWNKFGYRETLTSAGGEQTIWAASGNYTIPLSAETFDIAYDGTAGGSTDGSGTNGATQLTFYYIDSDGLPAIAVHNLGTDGTDTTSFSGLGINRIAVSASGSSNYNNSDITITHTTSGNTMAIVPAQGSVTQQAIFHVGSNHNAAAKFLTFNVNKLSGSNPKVTVKGYVFNRGVETTFEIYRHIIDTQSENTVTLIDPVNFRLNAADVLYFVADTDANNTVITLRFSLNEYQRT